MKNAIEKLEKLISKAWTEKEKNWIEGLKSDLGSLRAVATNFEKTVESWASKNSLEEVSDGTFTIYFGEFINRIEGYVQGMKEYREEVLNSKDKNYVWASLKRAGINDAKEKIRSVLQEEDLDNVRRLYMSAWRELSSSDIEAGKDVAREIEHTLNSVLKLGSVDKAKERAEYLIKRLDQIEE